MNPDKEQKRELDRPWSPTPDPAAPHTTHTEYLHNEAPEEDNDTVEPTLSEECSNKAHKSVGATAAETFFNITELRFMLYKTIANSATSPVSEFSGLLLSSRAIYSEAETEIVDLRKKYIDAEESKWSDIWGLPVAINRPLCYRDLNTATVTVPLNYYRPLSSRLYGYRGLWGQGKRSPQWPLRDLALPRLNMHLSLENVVYDWYQIIITNRVIWALLSSSQLSPDSCFKSKCVNKTPLRAQYLYFTWGEHRSQELELVPDGVYSWRGWERFYMSDDGIPAGVMVKRTFTWTD